MRINPSYLTIKSFALTGYELFSAALGVIPEAIYGRRVSVRVRHGLVRVSRHVL